VPGDYPIVRTTKGARSVGMDGRRGIPDVGAINPRERPELKAPLREIVERERDVLAVEINLENTVDRLANRGEFVERGLEKALLKIPTDDREKNDEPGMQRLRRIEPPKVARVVGDQDEAVVAGVAHHVPIFPARPADVGDVVCLMAGLSGDSNQPNAEAFVDQKPHGSAMLSTRRRLRTG
jgi:hypothetical protein